LRFFITSTGQNHPENAFKEIDSPWVKTVLGFILKKLYVGAGVFIVLVLEEVMWSDVDFVDRRQGSSVPGGCRTLLPKG
jgi:hypothetical protein